MNINRCKTCKFFDNFFNACKLYTEEVYLGEGDIDEYPVFINEVIDEDCFYEPI